MLTHLKLVIKWNHICCRLLLLFLYQEIHSFNILLTRCIFITAAFLSNVWNCSVRNAPDSLIKAFTFIWFSEMVKLTSNGTSPTVKTVNASKTSFRTFIHVCFVRLCSRVLIQRSVSFVKWKFSKIVIEMLGNWMIQNVYTSFKY